MSRPGRSAHIGACGVAIAGEPAALSDEAGQSAEFRLEADGLRIGEDHFVIWPDDRSDWYRTTMRTLGAVNFVLDQKGSAFQLVVACAGGNEAIVWAMHPEVARAVNESGGEGGQRERCMGAEGDSRGALCAGSDLIGAMVATG